MGAQFEAHLVNTDPGAFNRAFNRGFRCDLHGGSSGLADGWDLWPEERSVGRLHGAENVRLSGMQALSSQTHRGAA